MSETKLLLSNIIIIVKLFNVILYTITFYTTLGTLVKFRQRFYFYLWEKSCLYIKRPSQGNKQVTSDYVPQKLQKSGREARL